jgi:hypothetical protein|tara:strand:- start:31993 stop:32619 length:627 start_codon:yes stop_codon:yes gene_type:complete
MPFRDLHDARIRKPGRIVGQKTIAPGVTALLQVGEGGRGSRVQSLRFDRRRFTPAQARKWIKDHDQGPILEFTTATDKRMSEFEIVKIHDDKRLVFGWANIALTVDGELVEDTQHETIEPAELEKAAYEFVLEFRDSGVNHEGVAKGRLVESLVFTAEKLDALGLEEGALPQGWWVGFKIDDETVFKRVKSGELRMFSIQGSASRETA